MSKEDHGDHRHGGHDHEQVGPFHGRIAGQSISDWTEDWYTWAMQAPSEISPLTGGVRADGVAGYDAGRMYFLGSYDTSGGPLQATVQHGDAILVPLVNFVDTLDPKPVANAALKDGLQSVESLFAIVDGKSIDHLRAGLIRTDFFSAGPTQEGSWADVAGAKVGEELTPSKGVGYWIVLQGLTKGSHTIEFGGTTDKGLSFDTKDVINVV